MSPVYRVRSRRSSVYGLADVLAGGVFPVIGTHPTTMGTARKLHRAPLDGTGLRLLYYNGAPNDIQIAAAFDLPTYTGLAPLTFNGGELSPVVGPNGFIESDPCDLTAPGIGFFSRTWVDPLGDVWYPNWRTQITGEGHNYGVSGANLTAYGSSAVPSALAEFGYGPAAVLGNPVGARPVSVGVLGDSIDAGANDTEGGAVTRACNASNAQTGLTLAAVMMCGVGGTGIQQVIRIGGQYQIALAASCDVVMCGAAINDVRGSNFTSAQVKAAWLELWAVAAARGGHVFQRTCLPTSDFSGSGALTTPQEAVRVACNDWLRAGAPIDPTSKAAVAMGTNGALVAGATGHPLTGYWDPCTALETSLNSNVQVNGMFEDGTHPSQNGYDAMATTVPLAAMGIS